MKELFNKEQQKQKEYKASIPDSDMSGWINTLRNGGFTEEEMNAILLFLNETYRKIKGPEIVEKKLKEIEKYIFEKCGRRLTSEQADNLRKGIEIRLGNKK